MQSRSNTYSTDQLLSSLGIFIALLVTAGVFFLLYRIMMLVDWTLLTQIYPRFLYALFVVLKIIVISGVLAIVTGTFVGLGRISSSSITSGVTKTYVEFFRGTPLLFQLMIIFFGIPQLFWETGQFPIENWAVPSAIIALTLNHSAYVGEAIKGGIHAVPDGQMEAARSLGLSYVQSMYHVILPQGFRNALAAIGNDQIILIKDTSLLTVIAVPEIIHTFRNVYNDTFDPWTPIVITALCYLSLTIPLGYFIRWLERQHDQ